jgi:serine/threonine protein kinase
VSELLITYKHLLKALEKLNHAGIIHYDLRANNIMYDTQRKTKHPLIIDFGLAFLKENLKRKNLSQFFYVFNSYPYWSIDVIVCSYIFEYVGEEQSKTALVTKEELARIYDVFLNGIKSDSQGQGHIDNDVFKLRILNHPEKMNRFQFTYNSYFSQFVGKTWWEVYTELIKYSDTWDNYSMAVIYLLLLNEEQEMNAVRYNEIVKHDKLIMHKYINLLEDIVFVAPNKRITATESLKRLPNKNTAMRSVSIRRATIM